MLMRTLRQSSEAPSSSDARHQGRFRGKFYQLLGIGGLALGVTACNGNETNNGTGGDGGTSTETGGGGGVGGSGGIGGSNPCEGIPLGAIAEVEVSPGEIKDATVNLGDSNPDKIYNDLSLQINGDVLDETGLALLIAKTEVNVNSGYELTDMRGFRTVVVDPNKRWRLNSDGICERNTLTPNAGINNVDIQPIITYPLALSALRELEGGGDSILELSEQTANGVRANISEINGEGHYLANSKPVVTTNVTRDQDGHILLDLTGTTDEGDGSNLVLENLGVMASDGLVFAAVSGQPGMFRSVESSNLGSFDLFVSGLAEGVVDDTTVVGVELPNTAPEFPSNPTATPNPTSSNIPVTITIPVLDADGDDVTVSMSFTGDPLGCTYDQNSKVVTGGSGSAVFTMTPLFGQSGFVYPHIELEDGKGGAAYKDMEWIWIQ